MKSRWLRGGFCLLFAFFAPFSNAFTESSRLSFAYDEQDLHMTYGEYEELQISLAGPSDSEAVQWKILNGSLPVGLNFQETSTHDILIYGNPRFTDLWCFVLSATAGDDQTNQEICLIGHANDSLNHPKFLTHHYLPEGTTQRNYSTAIAIDSDSVAGGYQLELADGEVPDRFEIRNNEDTRQIFVKGFLKQAGSYHFVLKISTPQEMEVYQQFQLTVRAPSQSGNFRQCPAGYYYDSNLAYCVQNRGALCPNYSYYDPEYDQCIRYPDPPSRFSCSLGFYFDSFLLQCVRVGYPRCPWGYHYDGFYNSCVPDRAPTCSLGYRWSWSGARCVWAWPVSCSSGSYWDPYRRRCIASYRGCAYGYYWDSRAQRCLTTARSCWAGSHWNPYQNRCVPNQTVCGPGWIYDWSRGSCQYQGFKHRCGSGYHFDAYRNRCIANGNPQPVARPTPRPYYKPTTSLPSTSPIPPRTPTTPPRSGSAAPVKSTPQSPPKAPPAPAKPQSPPKSSPKPPNVPTKKNPAGKFPVVPPAPTKESPRWVPPQKTQPKLPPPRVDQPKRAPSKSPPLTRPPRKEPPQRSYTPQQGPERKSNGGSQRHPRR